MLTFLVYLSVSPSFLKQFTVLKPFYSNVGYMSIKFQLQCSNLLLLQNNKIYFILTFYSIVTKTERNVFFSANCKCMKFIINIYRLTFPTFWNYHTILSQNIKFHKILMTFTLFSKGHLILDGGHFKMVAIWKKKSEICIQSHLDTWQHKHIDCIIL